ncbi:hypothetical protein FRC06_010158, partial [Ceratobasidium sp. 370]
MDFWSIVEAIGQVRLDADMRLAENPEVASETQSEVGVSGVGVQEAQARPAEMETEGLATTGQEATALGNEHVPAATHKVRPLPGAPDETLGLIFNEREGDYVERYPDPHAGAPINDKTVQAPDLGAYMVAAGNLGNPFHFDTAELLLTTGLTATGRDEHLRSHLYQGRTPWRSNKALMDEIDKLPHGPSWAVYEFKTKVNEHVTKKSYLFTRHVVEVVCDVMANPAFKEF